MMYFDNNQYEMEMMFVKVTPSLAINIISYHVTKHQTIEDQKSAEFEQQQESNNHIEWRFDDDDHDDSRSDSITFIQEYDVKTTKTTPKLRSNDTHIYMYIQIQNRTITSNNRKSFSFWY